ncbi:3-oxo-5-alpha-steroid 4-dehydrogenase 2a [Cynoglossus semilaevis]|uniref:3-oxo-5-alpha-steroid 4-dehydrogenase n=1 Tax=Cynoglossus semilaevis TaxID=244447 RepID=A0A3P8X0Y6_CYNSE|nr:3-oxo-5-alpha-steroid 4-dehydrogenase 2 [Cynoglossus semilaevis]
MDCLEGPVSYLSWSLMIGSVLYLWRQTQTHSEYGRYITTGVRSCSARVGWFLQEVPSFLLPLLMILLLPPKEALEPRIISGRTLLLSTFMLHYFQRSFIYAFRTRGRPVPFYIIAQAFVFCSVNGALQGHALLHCFHIQNTWLSNVRLAAGYFLFFVGMGINIYHDNILRNLRKPNEIVYKIPWGGLFEYVSGANFFGEIVEWCGYAIAVWNFPGFAFTFFTLCSIGPRAYHHHRDYLRRFDDYPRSRKALIPFIL